MAVGVSEALLIGQALIEICLVLSISLNHVLTDLNDGDDFRLATIGRCVTYWTHALPVLECSLIAAASHLLSL
jgi:hypothetical protein